MQILTAALAATSLFTASACAASKQHYTDNAVKAIKTLNQNFRHTETGLWEKAWWNSANALTTLVDVAKLDKSREAVTKRMLETTFQKAPQHKVAGGAKGTWLNAYYDDEGWWALAWINAYDYTGNKAYLNVAKDLFEDMKKNPGTPCGGKRWAKTGDVRIAIIANSLYLDVAASLANRVTDKKTYYADEAHKEWAWIEKHKIVSNSGNNTIMDGLKPETCKPGGYVWTYNVGSMVSACVEMFKLTANRDFLNKAITISRGIINHNCDKHGVLTEYGYPRKPTMYASGKIDGDFAQFKGIFVRALATLHKFTPQDEFKKFLVKNADSIWSKSRSPKGLLGANWQGPVTAVGVQSQSSAADCLVAAARVS